MIFYFFFNWVICTKPWMYWSWDDSTLHTSPLCFFKLSQKPSGLTFSPAFLRLPCAEIIGWHALTALFMTCFIKTASCIELGVCRGEFCFFALLGTGLQRCLISGRSQPGRLAVFSCFWKKKCYLHWEKVFFGAFVGFQQHDPTFPHTTCHVKAKKIFLFHKSWIFLRLWKFKAAPSFSFTICDVLQKSLIKF